MVNLDGIDASIYRPTSLDDYGPNISKQLREAICRYHLSIDFTHSASSFHWFAISERPLLRTRDSSVGAVRGEILIPAGSRSTSTLLFFLKNHSAIYVCRLSLSLVNKKARLSVLVRGAHLCHALLKALDSPLNYLARQHPKLKGYRLASHVSAFRRSKFSRDKVCKSLADPVGPPGGGSRRRAMVPRLFKRSEISISHRQCE